MKSLTKQNLIQQFVLNIYPSIAIIDGVEKRIGERMLPVDGYCKETNTVYQFSG